MLHKETDSELIRMFLALLIFYKDTKCKGDKFISMEQLKKDLEQATGEEFNEFFLKQHIAKAISECYDESVVQYFEISIKH